LVPEFVDEKIKATMGKGLKDKDKKKIKDDLKYIQIGCSLAANSELAPELIKNG